MKIVEVFTASKTGDDSRNEDAIVITPDFIAVLDGVTSKQCPLVEGMTGGRFAAMAAKRAIERMPPEIEGVAAVRYLGGELRESLAAKMRLSPQVDPPAVVAALYSRARKEIWRVGDLSLLIDGVLHRREKEVDRVASGARALAIEIALSSGTSPEEIACNDIGRNLIMPLLKGQHIFANQSGLYGYAVIDGSEVPESLIEIFAVENVPEIVIASDGYPELAATLADSEAFLVEILSDDPLLFRRHKSTKGMQAGNISFDDRSYVRFLTKD